MRTPIIAGNWKMYKTVQESVAFVQALTPQVADLTAVEMVVAPTFLALYSVAEALKGSPVKVSSQQMHWTDEGAYTSQISPIMLQGIATYAIIGHSECRAYLNETDETVNKKAIKALASGITPIIAVGESIQQRRSGEADAFVANQVRLAYANIAGELAAKTVLAYEPIWAIGTGENATGEIANAMIGGTIRATLHELYGAETAQQIRIQYGGSVKPENMAEYMQYPDIDGALVGGASLKVESFVALVRSAKQAKGL